MLCDSSVGNSLQKLAPAQFSSFIGRSAANFGVIQLVGQQAVHLASFDLK